MRDLRRTACFALLLCMVTSLPTHAATPTHPPVLVLVGHGNRHTDVTLRAPLVLDKDPMRFTVSGCGRYGGFYLQPLTRPYNGASTHDFGLLDPARFDYSGLFYRQPVRLGQAALGGPMSDPGDNTVRLPPGRYRAHLFGEGKACRVEMPVRTGLARTLNLRPTAMTRVQYADAVLDTNTAGETRAGAVTFTLALAAHTYAVTAVHYWKRSDPDDPPIGATRLTNACLDGVPAGTCAPGHAASDAVQSYQGRTHPDGSTTYAATMYEYDRPGSVPPGTLYGKAYAESPSGQWRAAAAALAFDLP